MNFLLKLVILQKLGNAFLNFCFTYAKTGLWTLGRILNRFSKDVHVMDEYLSFVFFEFLMVRRRQSLLSYDTIFMSR